MRKSLLVVSMLAMLGSAQASENYKIDPAHTFPNFKINHLGFSTMHGRFEKTSGELNIDWAKKTGSVDIAIDAGSVSTGFKKRDEHLMSPDFLNAAEFPEITYKSTKVKINDDNTATVEGNLTILGVSKPVTLNVARIHCAEHPMRKGTHVCGFDAEGKIKRSDFGVNYALPAIGDEMMLNIEVEAVRQ